MRYTRYSEDLGRWVVPFLINPETNNAIEFGVYVDYDPGRGPGRTKINYLSGEVIDHLAELENIEERKHGTWIAVPSSDMSTGKAYKCSECGKFRFGSRLPPYCQECGAKMDGERKEQG